MMYSDQTHNLFQRSYLQSSGVFPRPLSIAYAAYQKLLAALSCNTSTDPTAQIACMRAVPFQTLTTNPAAVNAIKYFAIDWSPTMDGVYVPTNYNSRFKNGNLTNPVPVIFSFDKNEGSIFIDTVPQSASAAFINATITALFGPVLLGPITQLYPYAAFPTPWWMLSEVIGDFFEICPTRRAANFISKTGVPTWVTQYSHQQTGEQAIGVFHGSELPYIFNLPDGNYGGVFNLTFTPDEVAFGQELRGYIKRLGRSGSPNAFTARTSNALPHFFIPYSNIAEPFLISDLTFSDSALLHVGRCTFWENVYPQA